MSEEKTDWHKQAAEQNYPWMNEDQFECFKMLCDLFHGYHHVYGIIRESGKNGICINAQNCSNYFGTVDFNNLTRAVVMAHDRSIRFSICPSGPRMLGLSFHKRHKRDGDISERHPALEDHLRDIRSRVG